MNRRDARNITVFLVAIFLGIRPALHVAIYVIGRLQIAFMSIIGETGNALLVFTHINEPVVSVVRHMICGVLIIMYLHMNEHSGQQFAGRYRVRKSIDRASAQSGVSRPGVLGLGICVLAVGAPAS